MTMQDIVAHITAFSEREKFSYRTYFKTIRCEQNLTLRTVGLFSHALDVSIAELLFPQTKKWMRIQNEQDIKRHISRVVERYRVTHKLLRKELAVIIGISMVTYTRIDRAEQNLTLDTIEQMADHIKTPAQDLLFGRI
jgi:DNA-binding XRE family transcriptional regulator